MDKKSQRENCQPRIIVRESRKMKQAIANHRALDKIIEEMREITQKLILESPENASVPIRRNHPKDGLS